MTSLQNFYVVTFYFYVIHFINQYESQYLYQILTTSYKKRMFWKKRWHFYLKFTDYILCTQQFIQFIEVL